MLEKIKILLGIMTDDKDELLQLLINSATTEAQEYTNNTNTSQLSAAITKMVIYDYNRLGTEGLESEGYSGVTYHYATDYPESVLRLLKSAKKIVTL